MAGPTIADSQMMITFVKQTYLSGKSITEKTLDVAKAFFEEKYI